MATINGTSGNDTRTGTSSDDLIYGYAGNDTLNGGTGADTLIGGTGNDSYYVDNAGDVVKENAGEGSDTVISSITYSLGANIENLTLTGSSNINGTGNSLKNIITGNSGNNILNGGTAADTMIGGAGNDTYIVDNAGDIVTEASGAGTDTVKSAITYTLGANVENLTLTGSADRNGTGNNLNNIITGNSGSNILSGGAGNDTLNGGAGADLMTGGTGNDTYYADNYSDVVAENAGEGTDLVRTSIAYYALSANVENLTFTGPDASYGVGNTLNNVITGNSGDNVLYGMEGNDRLSGGAGNDTLNSGEGADSMAGGAGNDTYYVDRTGDIVTENAGEGTDTVYSSITYTLGNNLENLVLSGITDINGTGNSLDNILYGNSGMNTLTGNAGHDTISGGAGIDTMIGGTGNDAYAVDNAGDVATENSGEGTDTVYSSITYTLGNNLENLTLLGTSNIDGTGNSLDNILVGNMGSNYLDGGTGSDTMSGGFGDDFYEVNSSGDVVNENSAEGTDTVISSISYTLGVNLEDLMLNGTAAINGTGNGLNNYIIGNSGINTLTGGTGDDSLDGQGGADRMIGGMGDDIYGVDNTGDVIVEYASEGADTVNSSITWTLFGTNLENLILTGTNTINGTGNSMDNQLIGNTANNTLTGGAGNDTYGVDNAGDSIKENAGEGTDTVISSTTWTLGTNLENLTLIGTNNINGTGNSLDNSLIGNSGNNILTGEAGKDNLNGLGGADTMVGGAGDDTYAVENTGDVITENFGAGTDAVLSVINYTLEDNVENLVLGGSAWISGTGNALANLIIGNSGNNVISGGAGNDTLIGGSGNDRLTGGAGADTFQYLSANDGIDTITDFTKGFGNDVLDLTVLDLASSSSAYLQFSYVGSDTHVLVDINGGGDSFVEIALLQGVQLTSSNTSNYHI